MASQLLSFRLSGVSLLYYLPAFYLIFWCIRAVYRITLHSLAKFPGPKFAAVTRLYEQYFEVVKGGRYTDEIQKMHQTYGPIVRISPKQLHIIDPAFYDNLYNFSKHIDKPKQNFDNLQTSPTFKHHQMRRKAFGPYFSKTAILQYEKVIQKDVDAYCQRIAEGQNQDNAIRLSLLNRCLTSDIILELTFGEPYGFLQDPEKSRIFFDDSEGMFKLDYILRENIVVYVCFGVTGLLSQYLPVHKLFGAGLFQLLKDIVQRLKVLKQKRLNTKSPEKVHEKQEKQEPIIEAIATHPGLPDADKQGQALVDTVLMLLGAGYETTGYVLDTAFFHLLSNPEVMQNLRTEIQSAFPAPKYGKTDPLPLTELEKLPYLTAVIDESLRMSIGVMARLPRINTDSDMTYNGFVIPKGTPVGMSVRFTHYSPEIFPEPRKFQPDRWMKGEESRELRKYVTPFSKGARVCLGKDLATAELYITIATVIHRGLRMELFETTRRDVDPARDFLVAMAETNNGVKVRVLKEGQKAGKRES